MAINSDDIKIIDSGGAEHPLMKERKTNYAGLIGFVLIFGFVMGIFGGVAGMVLASSLPEDVQQKLGLAQVKNLVSDVVRTEKVTVDEESATIEVVGKVSPAVVSILFTKSVTVSDPFDLFGQGQRVIEEQGGGTGFIITADGLIVTNKHVVSDSSAKYTVVLSDGKTYEAKVAALDPTLDLAIVKIEATGLPVVQLGSSDGLKVGQRVIAIGNALSEFQNTVTTGVLSATGRSLVASDASGGRSESLEGLLQTDAAINLGNSGGPLVNLRGYVIGINTVTASGAEGLGFAIPIDEAKVAIDSFTRTGKIIRAYLGVNTIQITKELAQKRGLPVEDGFWVIGDQYQGVPAISPGSPADKAGIREGDIIVAIGSEVVGKNNSLIAALRRFSPGEQADVRFYREGSEKTVKVRLGERSD